MFVFIRYVSLMFVIIFFSCKKDDDKHDQVQFHFTNETEKELIDVAIYTTNKRINFDSLKISLKPNEEKSVKWRNPTLGKGDGGFKIENGEIQRFFGYYTNGRYISNNNNDVTIKVDTIIVVKK